MTVMTGVMADYPMPADAPAFKGSVIIEWSKAGTPGPVQRIMAGRLTTVRDERDGEIIPCAGVTVHAQADGFITADVAVFLDRDGRIIRDASVIWRDSDGVPATFPFLVAEMRAGRPPEAALPPGSECAP